MPKSNPKSSRQRRIIQLSREIAVLSAILSNLILEETEEQSTQSSDTEVFEDARSDPIVEAVPIVPSELSPPSFNPDRADPIPSAPTLLSPNPELALGDLVEITNTYHNRLGERGHLVEITTHQVSVRLISDPTIVLVKWKRNVRKVNL